MTVEKAVQIAEWLYNIYFKNYSFQTPNVIVLDAVKSLTNALMKAKVVIE